MDFRAVLTEFERSLDEVDQILLLAEKLDENPINTSVVAALNKSALLLLAGKFESFAENLAEQYIFELNALALRPAFLPPIIRLKHTLAAMPPQSIFENPVREQDVIDYFNKISPLWNDATDTNLPIVIECRLSYGKHGSKELTKLFHRIGIDGIPEKVLLHRAVETESGETTERVNFSATLTSVIEMRNNILHEDASPSLTSSSMKDYAAIFRDFSLAVTEYVHAQCEDVSKAANIYTLRAFDDLQRSVRSEVLTIVKNILPDVPLFISKYFPDFTLLLPGAKEIGIDVMLVNNGTTPRTVLEREFSYFDKPGRTLYMFLVATGEHLKFILQRHAVNQLQQKFKGLRLCVGTLEPNGKFILSRDDFTKDFGPGGTYRALIEAQFEQLHKVDQT